MSQTNVDPRLQQLSAPQLVWQAPTKPFHQRTVRWYIGAGAFIALCVLYAIWTSGWTFLVVLTLLIGLFWYEHGKEPVRRSIALHDEGIVFGTRFIPWAELSGFWMLYADNYLELHFELKKGFDRHLRIQTGDIGYNAIHSVLSPHLPEFTDRKERLLDYLERLLKI